MTSTAAHAISLLFVPGDRPDRFDKAVATGADAVIIDLEDAVAADQKTTALEHAVTWLEGGRDAIVRINAVGTKWHAVELDILAGSGATIMLPKSESQQDIEAVGRRVGGRIISLVETARGVQNADALATATGVIRLAFGNLDLSTELGVDPASHSALAYARGRLVIASAAANIAAPIDGVTPAFDSPEGLADDLRVTRELGFGGKLCIHPRQVSQVNNVLRPTAEEVAWAEHVIASASGEGVNGVAGSMVDPPVIGRAESILRSAQRAR